MTWFDQLTGLDESSPEHVRTHLALEGDSLVCPNGRRIAFGRLETPSLGDLRARVRALDPPRGRLTVGEVVADVRRLHAEPGHADALFQVASQFNLLEMVGPSKTPDMGVGIYEFDHTQGPACAIACGAGTIYRNYFARVGETIGQSADRQIDCAADLGLLLGNTAEELWTMRNGYLLPSRTGLQANATKLQRASASELDRYRGSLRIGLQWNAEVTLPGAGHRVSQAYCSALPVAYGEHGTDAWAEFACLILEAAYEATLCAAVLNAASTGSRKVFLTLLGGGAFGNQDQWIFAAIARSLRLFRDVPLEVAIVSFGSSKPGVARLVADLERTP